MIYTGLVEIFSVPLRWRKGVQAGAKWGKAMSKEPSGMVSLSCMEQERSWVWPAWRQWWAEVTELQVTEVLKADFNEEVDVAAVVTWNGLDRVNHGWLVLSLFQCSFSRSRQADCGVISDTAHSWRSAPLKMPCVRSTLCRCFQMILN